MGTVTVSTTPVQLDDGSHAAISIGNTGAPGSPTVTVTIGSRTERFEPGFSRRLTTGGVAVSAVTLTGSTTLAVDTTGVSPTPGQIDESELAAAIADLALGDAALLDIGTGSGTVAAGNDSRITGAAQKSANLSDLGSAATARTNLGLTAAATAAVGTGAGTVAAGDDSRITGAAQKSANLSDVASAATARTNLGLAAGATAAIGTGAGTVAAGDDARIPALVVADDFGRSDSNTTLGTTPTGQAWTASGGTWGVSGGRAYVVSAALNTIATVPFTAADFDMQAVVAGSTAGNQGFAFRATSQTNGYVLNFRDSGFFKIHKFVGGVQTTLGTSTVPGALAGDVIRLNVVGSTFTVYRNGVRVLQVTDATFTTQTAHGFYAFQAAAAASRAWSGFSISAAGSPLAIYPDGTRASAVARPGAGFDIRDAGLVADGVTNDGPAFLRALSAAKASGNTMPYSLGSSPRGNITIDLPAGDILITDVGGLLGQEAMAANISGIKFRGRGMDVTRIIFKPTSAGDLCQNDYWLNIDFEDISFYAATAGCTFMHSNTTHAAQRFTFTNCAFTAFRYVAYLEGNNNNSEVAFINCHSTAIAANGAWLRIPGTGSDQFLNYWWFGGTHWSTSAPVIDADKGGHFRVYGLDCSSYGAALSGFGALFRLKGSSHAGGVCSLRVDGMRVEAVNADAALLYSEWPYGNVVFDGVDWSSQATFFTYNDLIRIVYANTPGPEYVFRDSQLYGHINVAFNSSDYQYTHRILVEGTTWGQQASPSAVVTYDTTNAGSNKVLPKVDWRRCRGNNGVGTWDTLQTLPGAAIPVTGQYATAERSGSSTGAAGSGVLFLQYLPLGADAVLDRIGVEVTTGVASTDLRLGIYADDNGNPGALLLDAGVVDTSAAGAAQATISQAVTGPGVWLAAARQSASSATFRVTTSNGAAYPRYTRNSLTVVTQFALNCLSATGVTGALPSTAPATIGDTAAPIVAVRFA